jgi:molecular chaperone GrpE
MNDEQKPLETNPEELEKDLNATQEPNQEALGDSEVDANQTTATKTAESSTPEASQAADEQPQASQVAETLNREIDILKQQLEQQNQQTEALKKRYYSLAADFDNFRKRTQKEKEELEIQAKCKVVTELLAAIDNFERARTQIKPSNDGEMKIHSSYQGVYKELVKSLKELGVSAMRPEGQPFDPNYHEAMMQEETNEYPEGTVIEQLVRGYSLGDRVLRHAMVKVATPKETNTPSEPEISTSDTSEDRVN